MFQNVVEVDFGTMIPSFPTIFSYLKLRNKVKYIL